MYNLGVAQAEIGEIDRAIISYETTLKLRPQCAEAWNNLGVLHREKNNVERAVECYVRAVSINPNFAQPLNNIGILYTLQGRARAALEALQRAVAADPTYAVAQNNLGVLLRDTGDIPEALEAYRACAALEPDNRNATQNYLLGLNYVQPGESEEVCAAHLAWGERFRETVGKPLPEREFDPETDPGAGAAVGSRRRLVVGYVSPDLYTHSVSYLRRAPLTHHDPNRVRMIVYSATPRERTRRRRSCARLLRTPAVSGRSVRTTPSDPWRRRFAPTAWTCSWSSRDTPRITVWARSRFAPRPCR